MRQQLGALPSRPADAVRLEDVELSYPEAFTSGTYLCLAGQTGQSTSTLTQGREIAIPFYIPAPISIARLCVEVTTVGSTGSLIRAGIRAMAASGAPASAAPLVDAGTIDGTSTNGGAPWEITLGTALQLGIGWYFYTVTQQGAPSTLSTVRVTPSANVLLPGPLVGATAAQVHSSNVCGYYQSGITGALPSTWTTTALTGAAPKMSARVA